MPTNYPNGVLSYGAPVMTSGAQFGNPYSHHIYVDAKLGNDALSLAQNSPDEPFLTMARAFALVKSGDVIHVRGKVREQLTTPEGVFDVSIVGAANRPRHADDHTESLGLRGSSAATWTAPASGSTATPLLTIINQGWRINGLVFQLSGSADACIKLDANNDSGDDEHNSGHAEITYCKIQSNPTTPAGNAIETEGVGFVLLQNNLIFGFVNGLVAGGGGFGGQVGWWEILGNRFDSCTNGIVLPLYRCVVDGNKFISNLTVEMNLTGGNDNVIINNYFSGNDAFETNIAGTGDMWFPNYAQDSASADITAAPDMWVAAVPNGS